MTTYSALVMLETLREKVRTVEITTSQTKTARINTTVIITTSLCNTKRPCRTMPIWVSIHEQPAKMWQHKITPFTCFQFRWYRHKLLHSTFSPTCFRNTRTWRFIWMFQLWSELFLHSVTRCSGAVRGAEHHSSCTCEPSSLQKHEKQLHSGWFIP